MKLLFILTFIGLCISVVLDPGNTIFHAKEIFFVLCMGVGLFLKKFKRPSDVIRNLLFVSFVLPFYGITIGLFIGSGFDLSIALGYAKSLLFFCIILVLYPFGEECRHVFSITTLLIIPVTGFIYYLTTTGSMLALPTIFGEDTVAIGRRSFGPILIDPCIFYKTCPLLIFGLAYLLSSRRKVVSIVLSIPILFVFFLSGTRANMLSAGIIIIFHIIHRFRNYKFFKNMVIGSLVLSAVIFLPYLINEVFFVQGEKSMDIKQGRLESCFNFWSENPFNFLLGAGIGSGFRTPEGFQYLTENTYLELIRYWGIILFPIVFKIFLYEPLKNVYRYRKMLPDGIMYFFVAFATYAFIEIPSNPLLISSTGMVVVVIAYSVGYSFVNDYKKNYQMYGNCINVNI